MKATPPAKTTRYDSKGFRMVVHDRFKKLINEQGMTHARGVADGLVSAHDVEGGRGRNWILEGEYGEPAIRLRPCQRGGVLGKWLGARTWSPQSVFREFSIWIALREKGIALPIPVFAASERRGFFWYSTFASVERQNAHDGIRWLEANPSRERRQAIAKRFAECLRRFHDVGAVHGDLHIRNVLIEPNCQGVNVDTRLRARCLLIDLDRTRILHRASPRHRVRELFRFARSLEKTGYGPLTSKRYRALVLSAYCGKNRVLRRDMLRWSRIESLGISRHRLAWRLFRTAS